MNLLRFLTLATILTVGLAGSASSQAPAAVAATCKDGTSWSGAHRSGACRGHKGVQAFTSPPAGTAALAATPATPDPAPVPAAVRPPPVASTAAPVPIGGAGQVWVNTSSKVYHCQGDRDYGHTKQGSYMSEVAARGAGARPSRGKACS